MPARVVRYTTALLVIAGCALVMWRGWDMTRFALADSAVNEAYGPSDNQVEAVRPWRDVPGLRFAARASFLTVPPDSDAAGIKAKQRRDELIELLSIKPLSSKHWILLSEMQFVNGEGPSKIEESLKLSVLTGPNEGYIMRRRGLFGMGQWEVLSPELQKRVAADLGASPNPLSNLQVSWLRQELSEKSEKIRQEIRTALLAQGLSAKILVSIGL